MSKLPKPVDSELYNKIKEDIYKKYPKHSAYRSGLIVKEYKKQFKTKYGNKSPYSGKKPNKKGLKRWFDEKWVNQDGKVGYHSKSDIYRPSIRITKKTPITHKELTEKEIKRARNEKYRKGRVNRFKQNGGEKIKPIKKKSYYYFKDYPDFKPNLSPREMFLLGSFGGTYWRPIKSKFYDKILKDRHKRYPSSWWKNIPKDWLTRPMNKYDIKINKYGVKVGTSLEFWESKNWIVKTHPYGWVDWYCDFFMGNRGDDDERQIKRWQRLAGHKGRFMRFLVTQILKKGTKKDWNNKNISPKIRQVLLHWGYQLTKKDFDNEVKRRKK